MKLSYFTTREKALWLISAVIVICAFMLFDRTNYLTLGASLIGITSLIYSAKGNAFGQLLMIIFSLLYGVISYSFRYYGEMITYLGMTMPMAGFALVSWLRNPYKSKKSEVAVNWLSKREILSAIALTGIVTFVFYWILAAFRTANLVLSTVSVTTSFLAVYLTYKRTELFALAYAANDIVLIALWVLAAQSDPSYWSVTACFGAFLVNDLYGYFSWRKMGERQRNVHPSALDGNRKTS